MPNVELLKQASMIDVTRFSRRRFALVFAASIMLMPGCGGPPRAKPVDAELARTTLTKVLNHWKKGGKQEDLQGEVPQIFVNDFDWPLGIQLTDYEILGDGQALDANLYAEVMLHLKDDAGNTEDKKVKYCIGTDPKLTVHRDIP